MRLEISVDANTEAATTYLMGELDRWLRLGLLSEAETVTIGQKLSSPLPLVYTAPSDNTPPDNVSPVVASVSAPGLVPGQTPETQVALIADGTKRRTMSPWEPFFAKFKSHLVQSFLAEVSVLWLLFLGVFLVVVSSGVLAASQWQSFSRVGQYAILLVYTLAFGGASHWAAGQDTLKTTAQMLKAATLLLIPLNMWMMDALAIGNQSIVLMLLASAGLSYLVLVFMPRRWAALNLLGLSWLHWGWGLSFWPVIATYLGTVGSAVNLVRRMPGADGEVTDADRGAHGQMFGGVIAIATLILLSRSVWIAQVPIHQLGLACAICGWLLYRLQRQYPLGPQLGIGLILLGWFVAVEPQPLQAIAVSGLASWLLIERLQQQTQERDQLRTLAILWGVGLQACILLWFALPIDFKQALLSIVGRLSLGPGSAFAFAGVWLYGYVGLMLLQARRFRQFRQFRQGEHLAWSTLTEGLATAMGCGLVVCTLPVFPSFLCTFSLVGLSLTLAVIGRWRRPTPRLLIYGAHMAAIAALLSGIYTLSEWLGGWTVPQWALIFLGLTVMEWLASVAVTRHLEWRRSAWYIAVGLSVIAYRLLQEGWVSEASEVSLTWLVVPGLLTWLVYRRRLPVERPQQATVFTAIALMGQVLLLNTWSMATIVFGVGAGLLFLHSLRWPTQKYLPVLTVGFAVFGGHSAVIWLWLMRQPWPNNVAQFCLIPALIASMLWGLARQFTRQSPSLSSSLSPSLSPSLLSGYAIASWGWSRALAIGLGFGLTLLTVWVYILGHDITHPLTDADWISLDTLLVLRYGAAATVLLLARFLGQRRLTDADYWELAYGIGLLAAMGLPLWLPTPHAQTLGAVLVALGGVTQLAGTVYAVRKQQIHQTSWHYIPLVYSALGLVLGHASFTATTGVYTVVTGMVALGIGRRQAKLRPLGDGGLGLLSLGIYELVLYPMLQASGGEAGDGLTVLALVGGAIALLYLLCQTWVQRLSKLTTAEITTVSLLHWLLSLVLALLAMVSAQSQVGVWLWCGVASLLALYAGLRGNHRWFPATGRDNASGQSTLLGSDHHSYKQWTWSGLIIATVAIPHAAAQLLTNLTFIRAWAPLFVCGFSLLIHRLSWQRWGWPTRPWQRMALSWPLLAIGLSVTTVTTQSLLLVGAFYAAMAKYLRAVRLSYLSLGLLNWALLRYLLEQGWLISLWLGTMVSASALFVLEVDPRWQPVSARQERHYLRSLAILLLGLTAIYQAEIASPIFIGMSLLISFGVIGVGLLTQVRAYLYMGTLTFVLQILRTIMMFISTDGRMLWAIGILLGITLMWVAATFEARRTQIVGLFSQWSEMLRNWD